MNKVRWGILGTGGICHRFAQSLAPVRNATITAVGSRTRESAEKFGDEFGIPNRHAGYEALAKDDNVDIIYVGTPHVFHKDNTLLCLNNGKSVLCEKPFAINAHEAQEMADCARRNKLFLMEAMWSHFFPSLAEVRKIIDAGTIGDVKLVNANFCFQAGLNPKSRLFDRALGGGAILDIGVYVVAFAHFIYGREPFRVRALAHIGETGVDELTGMVLSYDKGELAVMSCAVRLNTPHDAAIYGTDGTIKMPLFWQADSIIVCKGGKEKTRKFKRFGNGFSFEARAVTECVLAGKTESEIMPLEKTLAIARTLDRVRADCGMKYPSE